MTTKDVKQLADKFDHTSPEVMSDPFAMFDEFRSKCPVAHSSQHGGFYIATTYDAAKKVYEDYSTYSSSTGVGIPPHPYQMLPIDLDPPRQTKFRQILNKRFTPEQVEKQRPEIERAVNKLIDGFIQRGAADLASELVRPLLPNVVLPVLGVPLEDMDKMTAWIDHMTKGRASDLEGVQKTGMMMAEYLMGLSARRRGEASDESNIVGLLLASSIDGKPFTDEEIYRTILITLFGGLDTTSAVMLEALLFMARNPEEKRKLKADAYDWPAAVEELVRYTSPVQALRRTLMKDTELAGTPLKKGDWIMALNGCANRDEKVFPDADKVVLDRAPNPHIGFGAGAHICLGRNLGRLEIEVMLKIVLERMYDYRIAADFSPEYFVGESRGMKTLPVTF